MEMEGNQNGDYLIGNAQEKDEKRVAALVDFVLLKAVEDVWIEDFNHTDVTENQQADGKAKSAATMNLFCVERNVEGQDDWEIIEYSSEDFDRGFVQAGDGGSAKELPLKHSDNCPRATDIKLTNNLSNRTQTPMRLYNKPRQVITHNEEDNFIRKEVRQYVQEIITEALLQMSNEKPKVKDSIISDHGLLFYSPSIGGMREKWCSCDGQFIPPKIIIETVSDEDNGEDQLADDVVSVVLRCVGGGNPYIGATEKLADHPVVPTERKHSSVILEVLPEQANKENDFSKRKILERIPKLISVKRLIGFRRRKYSVHQTHKSHHQPVLLQNCDIKDESIPPTKYLEGAYKQSAQDRVPNETEGPSRKSQPLSRRIFSRLFGGKQYSPTSNRVRSQHAHRQE